MVVFSCEAGEKLPGVEVITPYLYVKNSPPAESW